jgi:LysR family transcriptional regulator, glycine cleavage system transcriptional activator
MRLPPLNAVRAFEAAARLGGMRQASEELFVTPGAVSQQIRALEEHFGLLLFERLPRAVRLTAAGQDFYLAVTRHLRGIAQAADRLRPAEQQIAITVAPDFASRWLMPRLGSFTALHPKVAVRVDASFLLADFERDAFDLGIRTAFHPSAHLNAELLFRQRVRPYCSPQYFSKLFQAQAPSVAWAHARLLHESHPFDLWTQWLNMRGMGEPNGEAGLYFSHGQLAILAAMGGEGVTLQPAEYVERELGSGALVEADSAIYESGLGYYLVWPRRTLRDPAEKFRDWLLGLVAVAPRDAP